MSFCLTCAASPHTISRCHYHHCRTSSRPSHAVPSCRHVYRTRYLFSALSYLSTSSRVHLTLSQAPSSCACSIHGRVGSAFAKCPGLSPRVASISHPVLSAACVPKATLTDSHLASSGWHPMLPDSMRPPSVSSHSNMLCTAFRWFSKCVSVTSTQAQLFTTFKRLTSLWQAHVIWQLFN